MKTILVDAVFCFIIEKEEGKFEVVERKTGEVTYHTEEELLATLTKSA